MWLLFCFACQEIDNLLRYEFTKHVGCQVPSLNFKMQDPVSHMPSTVLLENYIRMQKIFINAFTVIRLEIFCCFYELISDHRWNIGSCLIRYLRQTSVSSMITSQV